MKKQSTAPSVRAGAPPAALSAGLRRYLYFTAAVTGAAVLIVEILGAKILAPYFGTSHFVWTAQIAMTLLSLAAGYALGGWLVTRSARLPRLYACIAAAAVYLAFTVLVREPVAYWCLGFNLAFGSLLAALFLFFVPLTLLAVTGPFCVRCLTESVHTVGGQVGRLSALSTLGSVVGTVLIGYVLIPFLPNSVTMLATAGGLLLVAAGYFVGWGRRSQTLPGVGAAALLAALAGAGALRIEALQQGKLFRTLHQSNSNFGQLQVIESFHGGERFYLNDYLSQNTYDPVAKQSMSVFTHMLYGLAQAYSTNVTDALCIGLGVGIVPMQLARAGANVDVVEINPAVVPVAQKFFDLEPDRLHLTIGDGRHFLNRTARRYDVIVLDAFLGDSSPTHLMTREAFAAMRRVLRPGGVLVINAFVHFEPGQDFFASSLDQTLRREFRRVQIHQCRVGNVFFVATDRAELAFVHPPDLRDVHPSVLRTVEESYGWLGTTQPGHGRVLTDDFNPVEFYDANNREHLRRQLAVSMRP